MTSPKHASIHLRPWTSLPELFQENKDGFILSPLTPLDFE